MQGHVRERSIASDFASHFRSSRTRCAPLCFSAPAMKARFRASCLWLRGGLVCGRLGTVEAGDVYGRVGCLRIVADVSRRGICSTALSRRSGRTSSRNGGHFLLSEGTHFFRGGIVLLPQVHGRRLQHGQVHYCRDGMSLAGPPALPRGWAAPCRPFPARMLWNAPGHDLLELELSDVVGFSITAPVLS